MPIDTGLQGHSHCLLTGSFPPGSTVHISVPSEESALERLFPPIGGPLSAIGARTPLITSAGGLLESEQCEQVVTDR